MAKKKDKQPDPRVEIDAAKAKRDAKQAELKADGRRATAEKRLASMKSAATGKLERALSFLDSMSQRGMIKDGGQNETFKKRMKEQLEQYIDAVAALPEA